MPRRMRVSRSKIIIYLVKRSKKQRSEFETVLTDHGIVILALDN